MAYKVDVYTPMTISGFRMVNPGEVITDPVDIAFIESLPEASSIRAMFVPVADVVEPSKPKKGGE